MIDSCQRQLDFMRRFEIYLRAITDCTLVRLKKDTLSGKAIYEIYNSLKNLALSLLYTLIAFRNAAARFRHAKDLACKITNRSFQVRETLR